jgi:hypothetical protein
LWLRVVVVPVVVTEVAVALVVSEPGLRLA